MGAEDRRDLGELLTGQRWRFGDGTPHQLGEMSGLHPSMRSDQLRIIRLPTTSECGETSPLSAPGFLHSCDAIEPSSSDHCTARTRVLRAVSWAMTTTICLPRAVRG